MVAVAGAGASGASIADSCARTGHGRGAAGHDPWSVGRPHSEGPRQRFDARRQEAAVSFAGAHAGRGSLACRM